MNQKKRFTEAQSESSALNYMFVERINWKDLQKT